MRWAVMTVQCAPEASEAVAYAFVEAGCGGVMLHGQNPVQVEGSLPVTDALAATLADLKAHLNRLPEFGLPALLEGITIRYAEEEDWANAWKQYFKPLRVGRHLVVKPGWEDYTPQPNDVVLELDPGMAFGTGGHPTTQLCLAALEDCLTPGMRVADVGTGSGILAIAAAKLGASEVFANDIDPVARRVAQENIAANGLADTVQLLELDAFDQRVTGCDLIVANIVANTIIELAASIAARLKPGGYFLASGIVEEKHDAVRDALHTAGLLWQETRREDIWVCLIARRNAPVPAPDPMLFPPLSRSDHDWAS